MAFCDFNTAGEQYNNDFEIIPKGTIAKVRMTILPGGHNDPSIGLTGGLATRNSTTGSVYLKCEYVVISGQYSKRKIWSLIGISSPKGEAWGNQGRSFIKAIINSSKGYKSTDNSQEAINSRKLNNISELNGIVFIARIDVEKDQNGLDKNVIKTAITPDSKDWPSNAPVVPVVGDGTPIANVNDSSFDDDIPF